MTRRPGRTGLGYIITRRLWGGARTVRPHRADWHGAGSVLTRRPLRGMGPARGRRPPRGARTVMIRRPGRGGLGYIITRRLWGGARTVRPRRADWHGAGSVLTRRPRRGGDATAGGRHDAETAPLRGDWQCSRIVLHTRQPSSMRGYWGRGGEDNGGANSCPDEGCGLDLGMWSGPLPYPPPSRRGREPGPGSCGGGGWGSWLAAGAGGDKGRFFGREPRVRPASPQLAT